MNTDKIKNKKPADSIDRINNILKRALIS